MGFFSQFRTVPPVTLILIILNVIAFAAFNMKLYPGGTAIYNSWVVSPAALLHGDWYTLFTSMFLHGGMMHIACNMISLYYLGVMCEKAYGSLRYAIIYFMSGLVGGIVYCAVNYLTGDITASAVGASGAIFGLFGAYGWLLISQRKVATIFMGPTSKSDMQAYVAMLIVNLAVGFAPGSNIANEAHIGGMVAGFILGLAFYFGLKPVRMARRTGKGKANQQFAPQVISQQQTQRQHGIPQQQYPQSWDQPRSYQQQGQPSQQWRDEGQAGQYNPYKH